MTPDSFTFAAITGCVAGCLVGVSLLVLCKTVCKGYLSSKLHWCFQTKQDKSEESSSEKSDAIPDAVASSTPYSSPSLCRGGKNTSQGNDDDDAVPISRPCKLQFSLYYNFHDMRLLVHIICALNIPTRWYGKAPDSQVRLQLLPDTEHFYQTEIRVNEAQPIFNETFEFVGYSERDLMDLTLRMGLFAYDKFSRGKMLGFTSVPFRDVEWHPTQATILWRDLDTMQSRQRSFSYPRGELSVSLRYEAQANRISIIVLKATALPKVSLVKSTAPYCKVILSIDDKVIESRRTKCKRSLSPVWNQGFILDIDKSRVNDYVITLRVMNHDLLMSDDIIGEVVISSRANGFAREHWDEMMRNKHSRKEVAMTHALE